VSGRGILPIASSQDCAGPMCRTVADAAALLGALTGSAYDGGLRPDALSGVRLAVPALPKDLDDAERELFEAATTVLRDIGAVTVEVPKLPTTDEMPVLHYEFARDVNAYLGGLPDGAPIRSMAELAAWNEAHAEAALKYGQHHITKALEVDHERDKAAYEANRARDLAVAGEHGIDATLAANDAAAIVMPSWRGAGIAARAGYPSIVVPAGYRRSGRQPFGLTFLGPARSEALLLGLGYAYEQASKARRPVSEINPSLFNDVHLP
jgi:amidase